MNIYTKQQSPKCTKQKLLELKKEKSMITVGGVNTKLSVIHRTTSQEQKGNKKLHIIIQHLNMIPNNSRIHIILKCTWNILQDDIY